MYRSYFCQFLSPLKSERIGEDKKHKIPPKPKKLWVPTREQCELWPTTLVNKRHLCNHRKFVKQETFWSFSTVWRRPCIRSVLFLNNDKIPFNSYLKGTFNNYMHQILRILLKVPSKYRISLIRILPWMIFFFSKMWSKSVSILKTSNSVTI